MESLLAIGVGLVLRIIVDFATDNDDRVSGVLLGLWEGVVLNHFVRRMPRSFDPYLCFGFRISVDFLFTQSLSRLALVSLWALVGMLLADVAPTVWRDSGLRHLYRQVRKDVRHVKRAVPRIRIKNDLPSVRLFERSRSTSSDASGSVRSDRAAPSRSPAPSPAPAPGPARRPGRSPPGTFPNVSGWSETGTNVSSLRENIVINPGPSPALIPSKEVAAYERVDTTHIATSQTRTTTVQDTTITVTQSQTRDKSTLEKTVIDTVTIAAAAASTSMEDPSCLDPPTIPDDWVDVDHPASAQANEPVPAFKPDPGSTPDTQASPSTPPPSRLASVLIPPAVDVLPDIPDVDHGNKLSRPPDRIPLPESRAASVIGGMYDQPQPRSALRNRRREPVGQTEPDVGAPQSSKPQTTTPAQVDPPARNKPLQLPDQIPLPESRAASVIGGVYDQPQPRGALRDRLISRTEKATSELGVAPAKALAQVIAPQPVKSQVTSRGWFGYSRTVSQVKQSVDADMPGVPPKESGREPVGQTKSDVGALQSSEPHMTTPAQVDPPANILTQPGGAPPLLFSMSEPKPEQKEDQPPANKPVQTLVGDVGIDPSLVAREGEENKGYDAGPSKISPLDLSSPTRSPPPPFTAFAVPEDVTAEEAPIGDPVTQDEVPTELSAEQKVAEEKRIAFLSTQVQELKESRANLQKSDREDDLADSPAKTAESELEDLERTLRAIKARMQKKKFSDPPVQPLIQEVALVDESVLEAQAAVTSAVLNALLERDDAGPVTIQAVINRQKRPLTGKAKETRDAVMASAKRHKFAARFDKATPGIINITF